MGMTFGPPFSSNFILLKPHIRAQYPCVETLKIHYERLNMVTIGTIWLDGVMITSWTVLER